MAVRTCPHCKTEVSGPLAMSRSYGIECPKCETRLEVAPGSRTISSLAGLAAGAIAWKLSADSTSDLGAVLPNPAYQSNRCHYFLASGCRRTGDQDLDPGEDIEVETVPLWRVGRLIREGGINHALAIAAR